MAKPRDPTLRSALLQAAAAVFAREGYARASMDAVGSAAQVTKGGVYLHFASKEELFAETLAHWQVALDEHLERAELATASAAERLRAVLLEWLRFHFAYPVVGRLRRVHAAELRGRFLSEVRTTPGSAQNALRARIRRLLAAGLADASLNVTDPAFAAFAIVATLEGVIVQRETAPADVAPYCDPEALVDGITSPLLVVPGPRPSESADRYQPPF